MDRPGSFANARRWAEVEIENVNGERRHVLAKVPGDLNARVGDLVGVELASGKLREWIPMQRETRVTTVNATSFAEVVRDGSSPLPR